MHMDDIAFHSEPPSNMPTMVVAFGGWVDAGEAATSALRSLVRQLAATPLATIDPEAFVDFTTIRPVVRLSAAGERIIRWPRIAFWTWQPPEGGAGLLLFRGVEPQLRWRTYATLLLDVAARCGVGFVANLHVRRFVLWSLPVTYGAQRGRTTMAISFKGAHFPQDIILMGVRWYVAYPLSYRHVEELMQERGVPVDHATIQRWVVKYSPLLEAAFHRRKRAVWLSWRRDETSIKVKGQWYYLYRAVDKTGQTMDFLLTEHRDEAAALRFLKKALRRHGVPEKLTIDGSAANEAAIKRYNAEHGTAMVLRQSKYFNNMVEQEHRGVKRVTRPMLGLKSFEAAQDTLVGIELMHMIKKRQMREEAGEEGLTAAELFYSLAA